MKRVLLLVILLLVISCAVPETGPAAAEEQTMKLTSPAFAHNGKIPAKYSCDGDDTSPPLTIADVPERAKSLVLIMDDPDAIKPAGKVWDHWIVFNIPPTTTGIPEGKNPAGIMGRNTGGKNAYGGPCPPDREHRYFFTLYALDITLDLPAGVSKKQVEEAMQRHILEKAELVGRYERLKKE